MITKSPKYLFLCLVGCAICAVTASCSDYFDPETDDEFSGKDGYSSNTEMYTGFLGILSQMQAVGDKEILLTEPRGELIEPTDDSSSELIALYQYATNLQDNPYANPNGYYEVIIACNDYLKNMKAYRSNPNINTDAWEALVSSTIRVKVWAYKTLAEIYGQAVWLEDEAPLSPPEGGTIDSSSNGQGIVAPSGAEGGASLLQLPQLIDKCLSTLDNGYEGVASNIEINWYEWLDPSHTVALANSQYRKWNYIVPPYAGLYAELCLWRGACIEGQSNVAPSGAEGGASGASGAYYKRAADELLLALGKQINVTSDPGSNVYWLPSGATPGHYTPIWNNAQPYPYEAVSAIIYDYTHNQTNTLLKHFSNEYPNKYLLRPSEAGMARFLNAAFNPGAAENDTRYRCCFGNSAGQPYFSKFRPVGSSARVNAYQDDCHIYIYRAIHYHWMLCEALNHLKRFIAMNAVLNTGVKDGELATSFRADSPEWEGFASTVDPTKCDWTGTANWGTRRYPSMGIRGCFGLTARPVKDNIVELGEQQTIRFNDLALLDEAMIEFAGEGKVYPIMCRMAVRYGDPSIVANRVCPKYTNSSLAATVRARIMDGGYWVPFDLYK